MSDQPKPDPATITLAQQAWTRAFKGAIGRLLFGEQKRTERGMAEWEEHREARLLQEWRDEIDGRLHRIEQFVRLMAAREFGIDLMETLDVSEAVESIIERFNYGPWEK